VSSKGVDPAVIARVKARINAIPRDFDGQAALVGWWPTARYEDTGYGATPVAYVALIQEKGAPAVGIPARPFIEPAVTAQKAAYASLFADGVREVIKGRASAQDVLEGVGLQCAGDIRANLATSDFLALSPVTVLLRKWRKEGRRINRTVVGEARAAIAAGASIAGIPDDPLHESGKMQASLTNAVGAPPSES
jgi:hypothetical protein